MKQFYNTVITKASVSSLINVDDLVILLNDTRASMCATMQGGNIGTYILHTLQNGEIAYPILGESMPNPITKK